MRSKMFSTTWKSSKKPGKQRAYRIRAPVHIKSKFLNLHLSDELSKKHGKRAFRVKKGDRVKVIKGQFKGKTAKVERVDNKNSRVYLDGVEFQKKDGTKVKHSITASNLMITELDLSDKRRQEILKRK
jgi:large subunit ribosomal protein L24